MSASINFKDWTYKGTLAQHCKTETLAVGHQELEHIFRPVPDILENEAQHMYFSIF